MGDFIVIFILLVILVPTVCYIIKAKRKKQCIGCPYAKQCSGKCGVSQKQSNP